MEEMNSPSSCVAFILMAFFINLFTSDIICGEFWLFFIPTLLVEGSSKDSFTVCKISGSDVVFAHSCSLVEIYPPLKS